MSAITYLDPSRIMAKRNTEAPRHRSRTGYGNKLPTSWELQLDDKRWRRVYIVQWSNAGSPYVLVGGEVHFLGSYDPRYD